MNRKEEAEFRAVLIKLIKKCEKDMESLSGSDNPQIVELRKAALVRKETALGILDWLHGARCTLNIMAD